MNACTWPEQNAVDAWLEKHKIAVPFEVSMELKKSVSEYRIKVQSEATPTPLADAAAIAEREADWQTGIPPTKNGDYDEYIVAVRRSHAPEKVFVFSANYANAYTDDESMHDSDGNPFTANGWYSVGSDMSGEFSYVFEKVLSDGDEVLGWQRLPKWKAARAALATTAPEKTDREVGGILK